MEKQDNQQRKLFYSQWLEKMQQESWQLELLISGLTLAGIYNLKGFILDLENYEFINFPFYSDFLEGRIFHWFLVIIRLGWVIFMVNLLVHVLVRALWISAIGLRYVSGDISYENLDYSSHFTRFYKKNIGSFDVYIEKLERYSSLIFSFSFLCFFIVLSSVLIIAELNVLFWIVEKNLPGDYWMWLPAMSFLFFFVPAILLAIDFLTLGRIKRIKEPVFSILFYYMTRVFSFFSLSFLYRPLILNFIDSGFARWFYWMTIPYVLLVAFFFPNIHVQTLSYFPYDISEWTNLPNPVSRINSHYDDLRKIEDQRKNTKSLAGIFSLKSYWVENGNLEFFIRMFRHDNKLLRQLHPELIPVYKEGVFINRIQKITEDFPDSVDVKKVSKILVDQYKDSLRKSYSLRRTVKDEAYFYKVSAFRSYVNDSLQLLNAIKRRQNFEKICSAVLGLIRLSVDGQEINSRVNCQFTVHPDTGEEGLWCFCQLDSLGNGLHQLGYERKFWKKVEMDNQEELDTFYIVRHEMPFLNIAE